MRNLLIVRGGESLALSGLAYTSRTDKLKPLTSSLRIENELSYGSFRFSGLYSKDDWGPEEFQWRLGQTFDRLYRVQLEKSFRTLTTVGISYTRAREEDNRFLADTLGGFDETRLFLSQRFQSLFHFTPPVEYGANKPPVEPEAPFWVKLTASTDTLVVEDTAPAKVYFQPTASDPRKVIDWTLDIREESTNLLVKSFSGSDPFDPATWTDPKNTLPQDLYWDGRDTNGQLVPGGRYRAMFYVIKGGQYISAVTPIRVVYRLKDIPTTEEEEGLKVSFTSQILFETGQYALRPEALKQLDQVVQLLKIYKKNRVRVEGHTDSVGNIEENKVLSRKRSQSVVDYFVKTGRLPAARFDALGWGDEKPIATNETPEGRQVNRRVEITILKEAYRR